MKGPHSNKASVSLAIQKQLCKDIEENGGLSALIRSKKGALTSLILSKRPDIYGGPKTPRRIQVLSKIGDWKRLYKQGMYQEVAEMLLGNISGGEESLSFVETDDEEQSTAPPEPETPPTKSPKKTPTKTAAKTPATTPAKTPAKELETSTSAKAKRTPAKVHFESSPPSPTSSPPASSFKTMAEDLLMKNSIMSMKDQIGEFLVPIRPSILLTCFNRKR